MSRIAEQMNGEMFRVELMDWIKTASPDQMDELVTVMAAEGLRSKGWQDQMEAIAEMARRLRESGATSYDEYQSMKN